MSAPRLTCRSGEQGWSAGVINAPEGVKASRLAAHGSPSLRMMSSEVRTMIPAQGRVGLPLILGRSGAAVLYIFATTRGTGQDAHAQGPHRDRGTQQLRPRGRVTHCLTHPVPSTFFAWLLRAA